MTDLLADAGEYAADLESKHPGVWRSLKLAAAKANRDPSYQSRYRALLGQSLERVKSERKDVMEGDELQAAVREFWVWYDAFTKSQGVPELESRRGLMPHQDWMCKWYPKEWERFHHAYGKVVENGTRSAVLGLRPSAESFIKAYVGADGVRHGNQEHPDHRVK